MPASVRKSVAKPDQKDVAGRPADEGGDHGCVSCWLKVLSAALQIALRVDQEGCGGDHLLAQASDPPASRVAFAATAELDPARLEPPLPLGDEHDLLRAAVDDGVCREPP